MKADFQSALSLVADDHFQDWGYQRRSGSFRYVHRDQCATHTVLFSADYFPKYEPTAEIAILPVLRVAMPEVSQMALRLVDGDRMLLADAPDLVVAQPLDFSAPYRFHEWWFAVGHDEIQRCVQKAVSFFETWGLPLMDDLRCSRDLIAVCTDDDERLLKQEHWYVFVAAALALDGRNEDACSLLRDRLAPGMQRMYAAVFENLDCRE